MNVIICPSDADGEEELDRLKTWTKTFEPNAGDDHINPCYFWEISYTYYGYAFMPKDLLMPGADATIPAEDRLAIETFMPHHRVTSGKQVLYWKQRDLACLMVSDLDQQGLASMFLKVRKAT